MILSCHSRELVGNGKHGVIISVRDGVDGRRERDHDEKEPKGRIYSRSKHGEVIYQFETVRFLDYGRMSKIARNIIE